MTATPRQRLRARVEDWELLLNLLRSQDLAARQHAVAGMCLGLGDLEADTRRVMRGRNAEADGDGHAEVLGETFEELNSLVRDWRQGPRPGEMETLLHRFAVAGEDLLLGLREELRRGERVIPFPKAAARRSAASSGTQRARAARVMRFSARAASLRNR